MLPNFQFVTNLTPNKSSICKSPSPPFPVGDLQIEDLLGKEVLQIEDLLAQTNRRFVRASNLLANLTPDTCTKGAKVLQIGPVPFGHGHGVRFDSQQIFDLMPVPNKSKICKAWARDR